MTAQHYESPFTDVVGSTVLGGGAFVKAIKDTYLTDKPVDRDVPAVRELSPTNAFHRVD